MVRMEVARHAVVMRKLYQSLSSPESYLRIVLLHNGFVSPKLIRYFPERHFALKVVVGNFHYTLVRLGII